jgi:hypothetical protein
MLLLLADRLVTGAELWRTAAAAGAELLWRTRTNAVLPVLETLADGSYLSQISAATDRRHGVAPTVVRVVEYRLDDPGRPKAKGQVYRLLTTILDPPKAPAGELAALYHQRWEAGGLLDELKTHQRGPGVVLRSKTPQMVAQEIWAMLLGHPHADAPGRPGRRDAGSRPAVVCPLLAGGSPPGHRPGRVFPLTGWPARSPRPSPSCAGSWSPAASVPTPGSSSARCPTSVSSVPSIEPGRSRPSPSTKRSSSWGRPSLPRPRGGEPESPAHQTCARRPASP